MVATLFPMLNGSGNGDGNGSGDGGVVVSWWCFDGSGDDGDGNGSGA